MAEGRYDTTYKLGGKQIINVCDAGPDQSRETIERMTVAVVNLMDVPPIVNDSMGRRLTDEQGRFYGARVEHNSRRITLRSDSPGVVCEVRDAWWLRGKGKYSIIEL